MFSTGLGPVHNKLGVGPGNTPRDRGETESSLCRRFRNWGKNCILKKN